MASQAGARPGRVRGVVIDSLLGAYLPNARVLLQPGTRTTYTDSAGRFAFDSVPAGAWTLTFRHPELDSIGMTPGTVPVRVFGAATASTVLATPGFSTLRAPFCAEVADSLSPTLAYGSVSTSDGSRVKVDVGVSWISEGDAARPGSVRTLPDGARQTWIACGVPWGAWIHAFVRDSARTTSAYLRMGDRGIIVHDLIIGGGTRMVRGVVRAFDDTPVAGARVAIPGTSLFAHTDDAGAFVIANVPNGTLTLDARAAGFAPQLVATSDSAPVASRLYPITESDESEPHGSDYLRLLERSGHAGAVVMAGTSLIAEPSIAELLPAAACAYWIDGRPTSKEFLLAQPKSSWRALEVYVKGADAPPEYRRTDCAVVLLWTAAADW